jgi:hypothetical protein
MIVSLFKEQNIQFMPIKVYDVIICKCKIGLVTLNVVNKYEQ